MDKNGHSHAFYCTTFPITFGGNALGEDEEIHLLIIDSPYRSLIRPLLAYIDTIHERHPQDTLSVVLPEFVVAHWWQHFLHNQTALQLKAALLFRPGIVVVNLPQHLRDRRRHSGSQPGRYKPAYERACNAIHLSIVS